MRKQKKNWLGRTEREQLKHMQRWREFKWVDPDELVAEQARHNDLVAEKAWQEHRKSFWGRS